MTKLNDKYYEGIVVSDEIDPNHAGAVRVAIVGVTDELKKEHQPWAIPAVVNLSAVPTKGTYLEVTFDAGDVNKPKYFNASANAKEYVPRGFADEYPNVAIANLGGDFFSMYHNRKTKDTLFTHPSRSIMMWNNFGTLVHDTERGYANAGRGANQQAGRKVHPVLTEATIDPFCCTPVGAGAVNQGSEYLMFTHVSQATVDAVNGQSNVNANTDENDFEETGVDETILNPLYDINGEEIAEVTFFRTQAFIKRNVERNPTHVIIGLTGNDDWVETSQKILSKDNQLSAHYLIGQQANVPQGDNAGDEEPDRSNGFAQFVELENDAFYGNTLPSIKKPSLYPSVKANKDAISILVVGKKSLLGSYTLTSYQKNLRDIIINHIKYEFKLEDKDLIIQNEVN